MVIRRVGQEGKLLESVMRKPNRKSLNSNRRQPLESVSVVREMKQKWGGAPSKRIMRFRPVPRSVQGLFQWSNQQRRERRHATKKEAAIVGFAVLRFFARCDVAGFYLALDSSPTDCRGPLFPAMLSSYLSLPKAPLGRKTSIAALVSWKDREYLVFPKRSRCSTRMQ